MELTNEAIQQLIKKTDSERNVIRVGVTGGGCAGFEYIFDYESSVQPDDHVYDYGKFSIVIHHTPFAPLAPGKPILDTDLTSPI